MTQTLLGWTAALLIVVIAMAATTSSQLFLFPPEAGEKDSLERQKPSASIQPQESDSTNISHLKLNVLVKNVRLSLTLTN